MFGLEQLTGLIFFVFLTLFGLYCLGWIIMTIVTIIFNRIKTGIKTQPLLQQILNDNSFKDIRIVHRKGIIKGQNYEQDANAIKIRYRDLNDDSLSKVYDMLFHFYYIFQIKTKDTKSYFWLKVTSYFIWLVIGLFAITTGLVIGANNTTTINFELAIQIISIIGIFFLAVLWFVWTNIVEKYRKEILDLANDFLPSVVVKKIKVLSTFKAFIPLSENVILLT
ncbi:hypothetical protein [Spiroplasma chrysopicola]|uniref:Transmembrane protein n=1 Tax=Spiroplasma chrysopicola DF-1 TaxID=1276227 RepID=R4U227_9MOLU|nr:hypothetical protein [Spiroplasma chrysopicola]AGM25397.1 hypothetical protein SCHRY_v1c08210 [Spiroplasma chrysopicola DF-1]